MFERRKSNYESLLVVLVAMLIALSPAIALSQTRRWTLPVADGGDVKPSPPSVHGYLAAAGKERLAVKPDIRDGATSDGSTTTVQLTSKTEFFTAYGGQYVRDDLRAGQYVWVWYITADPAKAGKPPCAAVVMLWSTDPSDKPSRQVRWSFTQTK